MLKRTFTYQGFDGEEYTEDHYFNMTKAEVLELSVSVEGGYDKMVYTVLRSFDMHGYLAIIKDLIDKSYGRKSPDGKRFIKRPEFLEEFKSTEAYGQLMLELADPEKFLPFVKAVFPWTPEAEEEYQKQVAELERKHPAAIE